MSERKNSLGFANFLRGWLKWAIFQFPTHLFDDEHDIYLVSLPPMNDDTTTITNVFVRILDDFFSPSCRRRRRRRCRE